MPIESHSKTTIRPPYFSPGCWTQVPAHHRDSAAGAARMKSETEAGWEWSHGVFFLSHDINDLLVIHGYVGFLSSEFQVLCPMLFERLSMFVLSLLFLCFEASMLCSEFLPGQHHAPQKSLDSHGKWPFVMFDKFKKKNAPKKNMLIFHMGMDQYLLIPFLLGWTSILTQLFWCELQGYKVLTHPHILDYQRLF